MAKTYTIPTKIERQFGIDKSTLDEEFRFAHDDVDRLESMLDEVSRDLPRAARRLTEAWRARTRAMTATEAYVATMCHIETGEDD